MTPILRSNQPFSARVSPFSWFPLHRPEHPSDVQVIYEPEVLAFSGTERTITPLYLTFHSKEPSIEHSGTPTVIIYSLSPPSISCQSMLSEQRGICCQFTLTRCNTFLNWLLILPNPGLCSLHPPWVQQAEAYSNARTNEYRFPQFHFGGILGLGEKTTFRRSTSSMLWAKC